MIMASTDNSLVLTDRRVRYEAKQGGVSAYKSIPLHKVSCCAVVTKKYPLLLVVAAIAALGVVGIPTDQGRVLSAVVAVVCFGAFFGLRSGQLEISSDSGASISVPTKGLAHDVVRRFAEAIAAAIQPMR